VAGRDARPALDAAPPIDGAPDAAPDAAVARLVHVAPGADPRAADGSRDHPYPDAASAYAAARPGDTVFLLPGDHVAAPAPPPGVELLGSGADVTRVAGPLVLDVAGARVTDLTVTGAVDVRAAATLTRVAVVGALSCAATASLVDVGVRQAGVEAVAGCVLTWRSGGVQGAPAVGMRATGATLDLQAIELTDSGSVGLLADGGMIRLAGVSVRRAKGAGVRLIEAEALISGLGVADVTLDPMQNTAGGLELVAGHAEVRDLDVSRVEDRGLRVVRGARVTAVGVRIHDADDVGVGIGEGGDADLTDVTVDGEGNGGLAVIDAHLVLRHGTFPGGRRVGFLATRSTIDVAGLTVTGGAVRGVALLDAQGRVADVDLERNADVGLQITDPTGPITIEGGVVADNGTSGVGLDGTEDLTLRGLDIRGTTRGEADLAEGVHLYRGRATFEDVVSHDNGGAGVFAEESVPTLRGGRLAGNAGPGLVVADPPASATIERTVAEGNHGAGFLFLGGEATVRDATIDGTLRDPADGTGEGVAAGQGARVSITGGAVRDNGRHGLYAFAGATIHADGTAVTGNGGAGASCVGGHVDSTGARFEHNAGGDAASCP
jgi:hypothetical protein